jgi:hypothetical protein
MRMLFVYDFDDTLVNTHEVLNKHDLWDHVEDLVKTGPGTKGNYIADLSSPYEKWWQHVEDTFILGENIILSGRHADQINYWLTKNRKAHLFTQVIGLASRTRVPELKFKALNMKVEDYDKIIVFDDKLENLNKVKNLPKVHVIHVEN